MSDQSWVSTKEASILLGVSQRTIQNWVDSGKIKSSNTMGGHRRLSREDLKDLLIDSHPSFGHRSENESPVGEIAARNLRVLIVEDDYTILRLCELQFSQFSVKHDLYLSSNVFQALVMIGRHQPDVIITDLKMPDIDGLRMIREVIRLPELNHTKFIVITGLETKEIMKMGTIPEGVMVLPKPIPFSTVETILFQQSSTLN